ncbi:MAG: mechanosensitive ion channel protein MscS [Bacteroidetes bacterium GWF2_38_335]|nr:MAG: mechanosensitive ion channel protein MscS [Bacteroidetes bacterium GWF2_38_335]OFY81362.1 MAG: mechanosensitive ion channel protein MscS [Bacteroidetes bacterium RIFOXYA12_FULL_38_20]
MRFITVGQDISNWLVELGLSADAANILNLLLIFAIMVVSCYVIDFIIKNVTLIVIARFVRRSKSKWDDIMLERKLFHKIAHLAPAIVIYYLTEWGLMGYPVWINVVMTGATLYILLMIVVVFNTFLNGVNDIYNTYPSNSGKSIKSYVQVVQIVAWLIGFILVISILINKSPGYLLGGLGAFAAILILVFQDAIKGLVAGISLSGNDMVRVGDWISMPSHFADGTVKEISLNTVKVQNFDKSISMIPTYELISKSFVNWRGMEESGGRQIKRSIKIDMKSVKFCSPEMIEKYKKIHVLQDYIESKEKEISKYNFENNVDDSIKVNGRRLTNLGTFRKYIEMYLRNNPNINLNMTFLVRQLQPSETGMPIEIFAFSKFQESPEFEGLQADIFDHILSVIPEFELRVFQNPTDVYNKVN